MNSLKHNLLDYTDDDKFDVILMNPPYGGHEDKSIQGFFPDDLASSETADLFMSVIMYRLKKNGRAAVVAVSYTHLDVYKRQERQSLFGIMQGGMYKELRYQSALSLIHI